MTSRVGSGTAVNGQPAAGSRVAARLSVTVAVLAVLSFASLGLISGVHARDTYPIPTVNGVWVSLAAEAEHGSLYRPLYDGNAFGGTRYMPLPILAYAGAAKLIGDPILSAKLLAYAIAAALLAFLYWVLRRISGSPLVALGLCAGALTCSVGVLAMTGVQGDTLPVLLQLAALATVAWRIERWAPAAAGLLCALAILAKFSALWAPAAILLWLLARDRSKARVFGISFALALGSGLAASEAISSGRFSDNLLAVSGSSFTGLRGILLDAPDRITAFIHLDALPVAIMFPFALASLAVAASKRRVSVFDGAFLVAIGLLFVVYADPGTDRNHLLDVSVLAVVVAAQLWERAGGFGEAADVFRAIFLGSLVWAVALGYYTDVKPEASEAVRALLGRVETEFYAADPPAGVFQAGDRILSQDPYVPLALGQRPVVSDAFALLRLLEEHPAWQRDLIGRVRAQEFDKVVLFTGPGDSWWWQTIYFGTPLIEAILRSYEVEQRLTWRRLWVLVPKEAA